jgi:SAM-dependent methyltransferase
VSSEQDGNLAVWQKHARQWARVGAPLRPSADDGEAMLSLATPTLLDSANSCIVVMGVTPEVIHLAWPENSTMIAIDHSKEMIDSLWLPNPRISSVVRQASWQSMPLDDNSVDVVAGDGCLTVLPTLDDYRRLFLELSRIMRPTGSLILRCFVRPDAVEDVAEVAAAALAGRIGSFHALKWRLAMALSEDDKFSVAVADIHASFEQCFPDRVLLSRRAGWSAETINTIDAYKGVSTVYTFPTLAMIRELASPLFVVTNEKRGTYELSERCPTILFAPREAIAAL